MKIVCEENNDLKVIDDGDDLGSIFSLANSECSIRSVCDRRRYQTVLPTNAHYVNQPRSLPPPSMMYNSQIYLGTLDTDPASIFQGFQQQKEGNIYSVPEKNERKRRSLDCCQWYRALCVLMLALNFTACTVLVLQLFFQHRLICRDLLLTRREGVIGGCSCHACRDNATANITTVTSREDDRCHCQNLSDIARTETTGHKTPCLFGSACTRVNYVTKATGSCESLREIDVVEMTADHSPIPDRTRHPFTVRQNSYIAVGTTGWFLLHSRLPYNQQCSSVCRGSHLKPITHTVSVFRMNDLSDSSKDERFTLMTESRHCCDNCTERYAFSELSGVYQLRANDVIYVESSGVSLIHTKEKGSFLEAALLGEGEHGYRIYRTESENSIKKN